MLYIFFAWGLSKEFYNKLDDEIRFVAIGETPLERPAYYHRRIMTNK